MRGALPVARRVLLGVLGDRPTLALVVAMPYLLFFLFGQVLDAVPPGRFDAGFVRPVLVAVFQFILTYLLAGVGFLRERQRGTLERVLTTRASRSGLVAGYFLGFGAMALVQSAMMLVAGILFLDLHFPHGMAPFFGLELLGALSALGLGILISVLARTELQIMQSVAVVLAPQIILGGVFVPVARLPAWMAAIARVLPIKYLLDGMSYLILGQGTLGDLWTAVAVLAGYTVLVGVAAALALRAGR